ncbi:hypothetical protein PMAYCL1PPCAC_24828, partial [Pristionchus mayeri]
LADRFQIKTIIDRIDKFIINSNKWSILAKLNLSEKYTLVGLQDHCLNTFESIEEIMALKSTRYYGMLSRSAKATLLEKFMKLR